MASNSFHEGIRWFIIVALIIAAFVGEQWFNYAVAIALIFIILRTPLQYRK